MLDVLNDSLEVARRIVRASDEDVVSSAIRDRGIDWCDRDESGCEYEPQEFWQKTVSYFSYMGPRS